MERSRQCIAFCRSSVKEAISGADAPTALFASNDTGAVALSETCEAAGLSVPEHLSVVGFDDIGISGLHRISLTTVAQPLPFQAELVVSLLLERIEHPNRASRHIRVPVQLRARDSTGAARGR